MHTLDSLTIALKITQASAIFRPKLIQDPMHSATLVSVSVSEVIDAPNERYLENNRWHFNSDKPNHN